MAKKKKEKGSEETPESEAEKPEENKSVAPGQLRDGKIKPLYKDKEKQSMYDRLRLDGKTDTQARQIVSLKYR